MPSVRHSSLSTISAIRIGESDRVNRGNIRQGSMPTSARETNDPSRQGTTMIQRRIVSVFLLSFSFCSLAQNFFICSPFSFTTSRLSPRQKRGPITVLVIFQRETITKETTTECIGRLRHSFILSELAKTIEGYQGGSDVFAMTYIVGRVNKCTDKLGYKAGSLKTHQSLPDRAIMEGGKFFYVDPSLTHTTVLHIQLHLHSERSEA